MCISNISAENKPCQSDGYHRMVVVFKTENETKDFNDYLLSMITIHSQKKAMKTYMSAFKLIMDCLKWCAAKV